MGFELGAFTYYTSAFFGCVLSFIIVAMILEMIGRHIWSIIDDDNYTRDCWEGDNTLIKATTGVSCNRLSFFVGWLWLGALGAILYKSGEPAVLQLMDSVVFVIGCSTFIILFARTIRRQSKMFKKQQ